MELATDIQWGCALKVFNLPMPTKLKLGRMLDPPDPHGKDWCLLAVKLGIDPETVVSLESKFSSFTVRLLTVADCTIGEL